MYKNRLYNLPQEVISLIFEYTQPYALNYKKIVFDLKWFIWWHKVAKFWYPNSAPEFNGYMFQLIKNLKKEKETKRKQLIEHCQIE